jgi:hypothetical protein
MEVFHKDSAVSPVPVKIKSRFLACFRENFREVKKINGHSSIQDESLVLGKNQKILTVPPPPSALAVTVTMNEFTVQSFSYLLSR